MDGQTDRRTNRQMETLIWCGLGTLSDPPGTLAVRGLEKLFSTCVVVPVFGSDGK
jgi:hypothetical protein